MNLNLIKKNAGYAVDGDAIATVKRELGLNEKLIELLFARGINSVDAIKKFLYPNISNFYDPFLMQDMTEVIERLNKAIASRERIVVYGDYDADGVCASAILSLFFASKGLEVFTHIPNRVNDGYGLNIDAIERIIDECNPDIIFTCDCGISAIDEVEHALDLGVDVIVTDHHEVGLRMPNCLVINPHRSDCNYPYEHLCGAGVALKVVHALGGIDEAKKYFDLAALATIADLVPLTDENRLIVQLGLQDMGKANIGLKMLLESQNIYDIPTSTDIAYKIAPRVNAAGRMGEAYRAFEVFTNSNSDYVARILSEINDDNAKRKDLCDKLYNEAIEDLQFEDVINNRCIVLSHPNWEKGITGIVAARLTNEYHRPAFILVRSGDAYKGTARSVDGINVYDLLTSVSDLLSEFGGHSQAAGFSIAGTNIPAFKSRVADYLKQFPDSCFLHNLEYDMEIEEGEINGDFVQSLDLIEPTGNSNQKPLFKIDVNGLSFSPCKSNPAHYNILLEGGTQLFAFNYNTKNQFLAGSEPRSLVVEMQINSFMGKESVRGILKGIQPTALHIDDREAKANFARYALYKSEKTPNYVRYNNADLLNIVGDNILGTLVIAGSYDSYRHFVDTANCRNIILHEFMESTTRNNYSRIMVSPNFDENLSLNMYEKIVFLDVPLNDCVIGYINKKSKATVYIPNNEVNPFLKDIELDRDTFAKYFDIIRKNFDIKAKDIFEYLRILDARTSINFSQFIVCLGVFSELGIVRVNKNNFSISIVKGVKVDLNSSKLYIELSKEGVHDGK